MEGSGVWGQWSGTVFPLGLDEVPESRTRIPHPALSWSLLTNKVESLGVHFLNNGLSPAEIVQVLPQGCPELGQVETPCYS